MDQAVDDLNELLRTRCDSEPFLTKREGSFESESSDVEEEKETFFSPKLESANMERNLSDPGLHQRFARVDSPSPVSPVSPSDDLGISRTKKLKQLPLSLWEYLQAELDAADPSTMQDLRSERISNFLSVPMAVEQMIIFGFFICLDSFLYAFTILPLRFGAAVKHFGHNMLQRFFHRDRRRYLSVSQKCDLVKGSLVILSCVILHHITDASRMYHSVRGQETIKLYVIFNVLEIADRLCCSFGHDVFDSLLSRATLGRYHDGKHPRSKPALLFALCLVYVLSHTTVLFYQLVTLNVAINSYSNALLTLLMSNQFVEIKGAVFKKFEKENLFQMSCADIVERFQLSLMLTIIVIRNLIEVSGSTFSTLPTSYISISVIPSLTLLNRIFTPAFIVLVSELAVDWLKHAFITKFNHIRPQVYGRFIDVLAKDLIEDSQFDDISDRKPFVDRSPAVSKRLGFAAIPLCCLVVRVFFQILDMLSDESHVDECAPGYNSGGLRRGWLAPGHIIGLEKQAALARWLLILLVMSVVWGSLVVIKLIVGINLREFALSRIPGAHHRAAEDSLNARGRDPIGLTGEEREYEQNTLSFIEQADFDSDSKRKIKLEGNDDVRILSMETLGRFDIVKSRLY